jgi:hypothetical protein
MGDPDSRGVIKVFYRLNEIFDLLQRGAVRRLSTL